MTISISEFKHKIIGKIEEIIEVKEKKSHHIFYQLWYDEKKILTTYCSHGSEGDDIGNKTLGKIKRQLKFDNTQQLYELRDCSMTADNYLNLLKQKNVISN